MQIRLLVVIVSIIAVHIVQFLHLEPAYAQSGDLSKLEIQVDGYEIVGFQPFSKRKAKRLLKSHTGVFDSLDAIREAADRLETALHEEGFTLVEVLVPPQPVSNRIIKLEVTGFTVSEVRVEGNRFFSDENIRRSVPPLVIGEPPNTKRLDRALEVTNKNLNKRTNLNFLSKSSDDPGLITTMKVSDQKPWQAFGWVNNTGSKDTGRLRLGLGYQYNNVLNRDHSATLTYTTSPDEFEKVDQFGLNYRIPVYKAGGILDIVLAHSDIDSGQVGGVFDVSGKGEVYSLSYTHYLYKRNGYAHRLIFSLADKLFDNDVDFEGSPIGVDVRSRPLAVRYASEWGAGKWFFSLHGELAANLPGGSFNDVEAYEASRSGSDEDWWAARYGFSMSRALKKWRFAARLRGQYADQPLIPGEQFGAGGLNSARGFKQREVTGDRGQWMSLTLRAPPYGGFTPLSFVDIVKTRRVDALEGEVKSESLLSVGLGGLWRSEKRTVTAQLDVGYVVNGTDEDGTATTRDGDVRAHFNLLVRY